MVLAKTHEVQNGLRDPSRAVFIAERAGTRQAVGNSTRPREQKRQLSFDITRFGPHQLIHPWPHGLGRPVVCRTTSTGTPKDGASSERPPSPSR